MRWFRRRRTRRELRLARESAKLRKHVAELETELRKRDATIAVQEREIELLSNVVARDQLRVKAELAEAARRVAQCKGNEP